MTPEGFPEALEAGLVRKSRVRMGKRRVRGILAGKRIRSKVWWVKFSALGLNVGHLGGGATLLVSQD